MNNWQSIHCKPSSNFKIRIFSRFPLCGIRGVDVSLFGLLKHNNLFWWAVFVNKKSTVIRILIERKRHATVLTCFVDSTLSNCEESNFLIRLNVVSLFASRSVPSLSDWHESMKLFVVEFKLDFSVSERDVGSEWWKDWVCLVHYAFITLALTERITN